VLIATIRGMTTRLPFLIATLGIAATACERTAPPESVIPPAAQVPAPIRLTAPDVTEPPAAAPTAPGTYASMTPPFMQHTPPRPRTRTGSPRPDSSTATPALVP
jgi:hypothetical protein